VKTAVVLFNLGGPDSLEAVKPFLRNLFSDPAIITLPTLFRLPLASFIASRRAPKARKIYEKIGGASPILGQTAMQAQALEDVLSKGDGTWRCFVCMRYWHPMTEEVVQQVRAFSPDRIVLLPLYPQFSTTTTGSSFAGWDAAVARLGVKTTRIKSYAIEPGFIEASVDLLKRGLAEAENRPVRVLFSAHGLPEKIIKAGDPYQREVEQTAEAIMAQLSGIDGSMRSIDWSVCYQSRVGPLKWIGPSTESEIARAAADGKAIVLYPLSFVSEHSETLVELDIDYKRLAAEAGVPVYIRVPTVGTHPKFIEGLGRLVRDAL
jgi:ferrochelatase